MLDLNKKIMILQLLIILMLLSLFFYLYLESFILVIEVMLSVLYLFNVLLLKKETKNEFKFYTLFFGVLLVVIWLSIFIILFIEEITIKLNFSLYVLGFLLAFIISFKHLFGRNHCIAEVLVSDNEIAAIKKDFDLLSFSNKGTFVVATDKMYKKGEKVKVSFAYVGFKRKPAKIIGLAN